MEAWSINTLLICFGGGIVGTALGGLFAFVICGLIVFVGCLVVLTGGSDFLLLQYGLGPLLGRMSGALQPELSPATMQPALKKIILLTPPKTFFPR